MPLTASAGEDREAVVGEWLVFDGSASSEATSYRWDVIEGSADGSQVKGADQAVARLGITKPGRYMVQLTVTGADGSANDTDVVLVTATELEVLIDGPTKAETGVSIQLDASKSKVPAAATFLWALPPGPPPLTFLTPVDEPTTRFMSDRAGQYTVSLEVSVDVRGEDGDLAKRMVRKEHTVIVTSAVVSGGGASDDVYWRDQQIDSTRKSLETVTAAAGKWDASITALLGVFAAVAFVAGPDALKDVAAPETARLGLVLIGSAFAYAFFARLTLADVGNGLPTFRRASTPEDYRENVMDAAQSGAAALKRARLYGVMAALLAAIGSLIVAQASLDNPPPQPQLALARTATSSLCGVLSNTSGDVQIAGRNIGRASEITMVDSCGEDSAATDEEPSENEGNIPAWLAALGAVAALSVALLLKSAKEVVPLVLVLAIGLATWGALDRGLSFWPDAAAIGSLVFAGLIGLLLAQTLDDESGSPSDGTD